MSITNTTNGDPMTMLFDAMVRDSDGAIQRQEAQGQRELVKSSVLPAEFSNRADFERLGFTFGEPVPGDSRGSVAGIAGEAMNDAPTTGMLCKWTPSTAREGFELTLVSVDAPICGTTLDCGGECCLAPGHDGKCSCCGDYAEPGDCEA